MNPPNNKRRVYGVLKGLKTQGEKRRKIREAKSKKAEEVESLAIGDLGKLYAQYLNGRLLLLILRCFQR